MLVTDKQYPLDSLLKSKLDLMIARTTGNNNFDNVILIDGDEGYGKSNIASAIGYYVAYTTGRKYTVDNIFFDIDAMTKFAIETEQQVIHWDEAALGGLANEWWNKNQKKFIKLLMVARKKKHFFIICIPKFFKLNEYLVVDRSVALIHVYARKETELGKFVYFTKKAKEDLYYDWKRTKMRNYKTRNVFSGTFSQTLDLIVNKEEYEKKKDAGILTLGSDDESKSEVQIKKEITYKVFCNVKMFIESRGIDIPAYEYAKLLDVSTSTITNYTREMRENPPKAPGFKPT